MGGLVPPILGVVTHVVGRDEMAELIFLALSGAALLIAIPFACKLLFVTPEKMLRESEKRSQPVGEQTRQQGAIEAPEKPGIYGLIVLGCASISIMLVLILQISKNAGLQEQLAEAKPKTNAIPANFTAKALPDKIVVRPTNSLAATASTLLAQVTNEPPKKSFETNNPNADDASDLIANVLASQELAQKQREEDNQRHAQVTWDANQKERNHLLQSLYDVLRDEAKKTKEGVLMTEGYFQCVPEIINLKDANKIVGEIGFQIKTNVHFVISTARASDDLMLLKISSSCGEMSLQSGWGHTNQPNLIVQIPELHYSTNQWFQDTIPQEFMTTQMRLFVASTIKYSTPKTK